ncbi:carbon-nitrogen hydrolase family protein [Thalassovita sp.]|jgi:predicted amidohydrolase|uniref:carbon-nitrogen hydrolase family protein n=1 Tax=Thalassovita sp. TaxID=1979401 RepID=UPI003B594ABC
MKIATAAYPLDLFDDWNAYMAKQRRWVATAAGAGADLLVFPEYGAMELASLAGDAAADLQGSIEAVSDRAEQSNAVLSDLAQEFGVHILGGSAPVRDGDRVVNRAPLFGPDGGLDHQDKQIMTRFERDEWGIAGGGPLKLFDTALGKLGVLICYDSEFPLLARALIEAGAEIILVPSCTEALEGYWRVRIGAMARALEGQCVTVMASLVGKRPELYAVEENTGMGGVFTPPDMGFPPTGVLAQGTLNQPGWTYADVDLAKLQRIRADGHVLNMTHWEEQGPRVVSPRRVVLT